MPRRDVAATDSFVPLLRGQLHEHAKATVTTRRVSTSLSAVYGQSGGRGAMLNNVGMSVNPRR